MDVLHEIERSNGRQVILLQHEHTKVGQERGRYYVRGFNYGNPGECVSVYLTADEVDRLTAERQRRVTNDMEIADSLFATLRKLRHTVRR